VVGRRVVLRSDTVGLGGILGVCLLCTVVFDVHAVVDCSADSQPARRWT
jgi:hypothetical protein